MAATSPPTADEFPAIAGNLYARWTLDCMGDIAYAIANHAIARPQLYVSDNLPDELIALRFSYGTVPDFPNPIQRQAMMIPLLGRSDGNQAGPAGSFQTARGRFLNACAAFAEHASASDKSILEDRIRLSASTLRDHFVGVRGKSFSTTAGQIEALFGVATRIIKDPAITRIFGIEQVSPEWPLSSLDPNGAKLIESLGVTLSLSGACRITYADFLTIQRVAEQGSQTIRLLLSSELPSNVNIKHLITQGYVWGSALRELPGGSQPTPLPRPMATGQPQAPVRPQINPQRQTLTSPQLQSMRR